MSDVAAQFFSPWDPAPPFASSPADAKRADVLHKLAEYAVKNGATFVELIKDKQKDNPEYQFLFGGDDSDYYRWVLYCRCHNLPSDQPLSAPQPPQPQSLPHQSAQVQTQDVEVLLQQTLATCTPEVRDGFLQVLAALSGSKASFSSCYISQGPVSIKVTYIVLYQSGMAHTVVCTGINQAKPAVVHGMPSLCTRNGSSSSTACTQPARL